MSDAQTKMRYIPLIATCVYFLLYPFFLYLVMACTVIMAGSNHSTDMQNIFVVFFFFCSPFSIPISLYFAWKNLHQQKYIASCCWIFVPIIYIACILLPGFLSRFID